MSNQDEHDPNEDSISKEDDMTTTPLATFAIITDIQYADVDDQLSFFKKMRYYRNSLNLVREAVQNWRAYSKAHRRPIKFLIQLGDLVDGKSKPLNDSHRAMNLLVDELNSLFREQDPSETPRVLHIWGNHEFYNFSRDELLTSRLNSARDLNQHKDREGNYFTYDVTSKLRIVCLDFYEYSILGYEPSHPTYKHALEFLRSHNKNSDLNSTDGMRGHALRYSGYNGSISARQLEWLKSELTTCRNLSKRALVCGHVPVHSQACDVHCLAWNAKEVLECLWSFEKTVVAYLAGHDHDGGYFRDKKNIHHLTLKAVVETPPNSNSYATVNVFEDRISIEGVGAVGYYEISL